MIVSDTKCYISFHSFPIVFWLFTLKIESKLITKHANQLDNCNQNHHVTAAFRGSCELHFAYFCSLHYSILTDSDCGVIQPTTLHNPWMAEKCQDFHSGENAYLFENSSTPSGVWVTEYLKSQISDLYVNFFQYLEGLSTAKKSHWEE